jgi:hypothetical protein
MLSCFCRSLILVGRQGFVENYGDLYWYRRLAHTIPFTLSIVDHAQSTQVRELRTLKTQVKA